MQISQINIGRGKLQLKESIKCILSYKFSFEKKKCEVIHPFGNSAVQSIGTFIITVPKNIMKFNL